MVKKETDKCIDKGLCNTIQHLSYQGRKVTSDTSDDSCRAAAAAAASAPTNTERHRLLFTGFLLPKQPGIRLAAFELQTL